MYVEELKIIFLKYSDLVLRMLTIEALPIRTIIAYNLEPLNVKESTINGIY